MLLRFLFLTGFFKFHFVWFLVFGLDFFFFFEYKHVCNLGQILHVCSINVCMYTCFV